MADFDSPWKEALDLYFQAFLAFFFPRIHEDIDWSRGFESLDKELQQIAPQSAHGRRYVDKLVKVWRKQGRAVWVSTNDSWKTYTISRRNEKCHS
jgi:hypothetical protein